MSNIGNKSQSNLDAVLFALTLDPRQPTSLQAQLTAALRDVILSGRDFCRARLPSSRALAAELSVSRMTVTTAYDQLISEGYLVTQTGRGTFVADHLPHLAPPGTRQASAPEPAPDWLPFHPGIPDQALFPHRLWARHLERAWRRPERGLLAQPDPFGWYPLRAAIRDHLSDWRSLDCRPEQIMITSGSWEAFEIIFRGLLGPGHTAAIEDPGWSVVRDVLAATGTTAHPVRIDAEGFDPAQIPPGVAATLVTPSRHYPTGIAMPVSRRLALLEWARRENALVIEDDYDSEFRYQGHPLPALAGLDGLQQTLYLGSFSKLLSPALRIGYLVLPDAALDRVKAYVSRHGMRASLVPQPALAQFMISGEFAIHLRRMRRTYARRQACLLAGLAGLQEILSIAPDVSGMHICAPLRPGMHSRITDREIVAKAAKGGVRLRALSSHSVLPDPPQGLILGYAAFDDQRLEQAARHLTGLLSSAG